MPWQGFFKCLCFSRKSSDQTQSCTKPQYIKQPKSELAALREADEEGGAGGLGAPFTPRGDPGGGIGGWGFREPKSPHGLFQFEHPVVAYEPSAKDAQRLTSCHLGHTPGPRNTGQAGVVPEVR